MISVGIVLAVFFILLFIGVPVAYVVLGAAAVGIVGSGFTPLLLPQQTFLGVNSFITLAVPFFIISGDLAAKGKTSQHIVNVINAFLGRIPGGLGIATVFACAFFGAITGSAIATVVAIGALMYPKLLEAGYPKTLSIGIITCAGTLGVMIPPSIPMLMMAVALQTSVSATFMAGFIPGILTASLMSLFVFFTAKRLNLPKGPKLTFAQKMHAVKDGFWSLLYPVIILGSIYGGLATPTEAAVISVFYVILVELLIYRDVRIKELWEMLGNSTVSAATMSIYMATAQVFLWYMSAAKIPDKLLAIITGAISSPGTVMLLLCLLFMVVGCFTNVGSVVVILAPLLSPILGYYEINAIQFVIVASLMNQIGLVTPPFGLCLFVTMKMCKAKMGDVIRGALPFLICMIVATALIAIFPSLTLCLPRLLGFNV